MIRSLTLVTVIILLSIPAAVVFIPLALLTGNATPLYRVAMAIASIAFRCARIPVVVQDTQNVPPGVACIFMANHVSNLDPPALLPCIPGRTSAFLKRSLLSVPILGYGLKLGEFVAVNRDGRIESAKESVRAAQAVLQKGLHITTFVEGTRSADGRMLPFKKGPFYLAMEAGAPCIPVSIHGTESILPKGSLRARRGVAYITFHPPVYPAQFASREDLMLAIREAIASGLPEWMRA
ncbi:MAG TPA: lysophospholipid acyltransferase family protein [Terracidiphilus sp.]|nr:lysophospholipid acyltransferase family protein [Terracidiphilus sp.]